MANDTFDYGAKAADVAAAFGCAGVKPFQGALDSAFADAVTCTGASRIVLLVATCSDQGQYGTAIQAVFQHASEQGQGAAVAQGAFGSTGPPSSLPAAPRRVRRRRQPE